MSRVLRACTAPPDRSHPLGFVLGNFSVRRRLVGPKVRPGKSSLDLIPLGFDLSAL